MEKSIGGYVLRVKQFANGSMNIIFITDEDKELELHYVSDAPSKGELGKEIAHVLARTLDGEIWADITFDDSGIATSVELESGYENEFEESEQ